jgi:hypothetical protein
MSARVHIINIEEGFPARDEALARVEAAITRARKQNIRVLKLIHGYGSSGTGGILRPIVRNYLRRAKEKGEIKFFVNGESWSSYETRSKELMAIAPELLVDKDLGAGNKGITFVVL